MSTSFYSHLFPQFVYCIGFMEESFPWAVSHLRAFRSPSCGFEESQPEKRPSQNSVNGVRFGIDPACNFICHTVDGQNPATRWDGWC